MKKTNETNAKQPREGLRHKNIKLQVKVAIGAGICLVSSKESVPIGFMLKDGSILRPVIAFELEKPAGSDSFRDITSPDELKAMGVEVVEYLERAVI